MNQITKELIVCLVSAHIAGDFLFQSSKDASNKESILILLRHATIVSALSYLLCGAWLIWKIPLLIFTTHALIDFIKTKAGSDGGAAFLIDQLAHILVILGVAFVAAVHLQNADSLFWVAFFKENYARSLIFLSGAITTIKTGGIVIGKAVQPFLNQIQKSERKSGEKAEDTSAAKSRGLENGGQMIGQLERALIFVFILMDQWTAIGFLITAKSVFRFGEIKEHQNRMEAEYIIIGTLMSFGYGILTAYGTNYFMKIFC